jgi:hypothetical protein
MRDGTAGTRAVYDSHMTRAALLTVSLIAAASLAAAAWPAVPAPQRTVPCTEVIDTTRFPYTTSGYRTVLGAFAVPPRFLKQISYDESEPKWPYWRKAGLVVRANGRPVSISVPDGWKDRVAIEWGNAGTGGPFSSLRIAGCGSDPATGKAYAGGFVVSEPACVPVTFHAGGRSATVRFGIGKRCP